MVAPSRHFFDLSAAARLSRSLRHDRARPRATHPAVTAVPPAVAPAPPSTAAAPGLEPFSRSRVHYAEELWQALLEWIQEGFQAKGVFALDKNGFSIGSVGETTAAPAEVLMASFTSVAQLLEAYLSGASPLEELMIATGNEPPVTLVALPWEGDTILFGIHGGRKPSVEELQRVRDTVGQELHSFATQRATTGEDGGAA